MKKNYITPTAFVFRLNTKHALLSASENTGSAVEMSSGSFGGRDSSTLWDDEE